MHSCRMLDISIDGKKSFAYTSKVIIHVVKILVVANPVRIKPILESFLLLTQSVQFTSTINVFPKTPSIASPVATERRMLSSVLSISANFQDCFCWTWYGLPAAELLQVVATWCRTDIYLLPLNNNSRGHQVCVVVKWEILSEFIAMTSVRFS